MAELTDSEIANKKLVAGLLGLFLGSLGIHKFMLGYTRAGLIMLLVTVLTCGFGGFVMGVIGLIEGIVYLAATPQDFKTTYIDARKEWF